MLRIVLTILRREIQLLLMVFVATGLMEMDPGKVLSIKSDWMLPLNMGTETAVHSVSADFMQVVGAEVFLPESVTISISDDGANFTELKQYTFEVNRKEAIKFISISWEGSAEGRYIRYQARAGEEFGGWIFTDEIVVK